MAEAFKPITSITKYGTVITTDKFTGKKKHASQKYVTVVEHHGKRFERRFTPSVAAARSMHKQRAAVYCCIAEKIS